MTPNNTGGYGAGAGGNPQAERFMAALLAAGEMGDGDLQQKILMQMLSSDPAEQERQAQEEQIAQAFALSESTNPELQAMGSQMLMSLYGGYGDPNQQAGMGGAPNPYDTARTGYQTELGAMTNPLADMENYNRLQTLSQAPDATLDEYNKPFSFQERSKYVLPNFLGGQAGNITGPQDYLKFLLPGNNERFARISNGGY